MSDGDQRTHATDAAGVWAERIRVRELARAERQLRGLTDTEREIVDAVTRNLVAALLRDPRSLSIRSRNG